MQINVDSLFRSAVILAIGLPITFGIGAVIKDNLKEVDESAAQVLKTELEVPCLRFALTKPESKGERVAKDAVDEVFGEGADYREVCKWVLG